MVWWISRSFTHSDVCMCLREAGGMVMSDTQALTGLGPLQVWANGVQVVADGVGKDAQPGHVLAPGQTAGQWVQRAIPW